MAPSLYAYPDDPRPAVKAFMQKYKARYGVDVNYLGQMGYTSAQIAIEALQRAGRDLTVDSLVKAMESIQDSTTYSAGPTRSARPTITVRPPHSCRSCTTAAGSRWWITRWPTSQTRRRRWKLPQGFEAVA